MKSTIQMQIPMQAAESISMQKETQREMPKTMQKTIKTPIQKSESSFKNALIAAILTIILTMPILGLEIQTENMKMVLNANWSPVLWAAGLVFVWQIIHPIWQRLMGQRIHSVKLHFSATLSRTRNHISAQNLNFLYFAVFVIAVLWPFWGSRSAIDIATLALIYILLGLGINIVVGYAGLLDLGYVGFYAVGAYTFAILNQNLGWGFWTCLPLAAILAALFGFLLGFPVLRLRGDYLAIVTLGFGEIIRLLLRNLNTYTGGPDGISDIPKPTIFGIEMARNASEEGIQTFHELLGWEYQGIDMVIYLYLIGLLLVGMGLFVSSRLVRLPMGRAWEALRDDEIACRSLGLNPTHIKLSAFTLGAAFAGVAGAFFAARQGLVNPESFSFIESALILAIVVLGGMGSLSGVVLAAILITVLPELARGFSEYRMLAFGLVMVLMMIWRPQGLLPARRSHLELPSQEKS